MNLNKREILLKIKAGELSAEEGLRLLKKAAEKPPAMAEAAAAPTPPAAAEPASGAADLAGRLRALTAEALELATDDIDPALPFSDYGVDSIVGVELVNKINEALGLNLKTTILFDYSTVDALAAKIAEDHGDLETPTPSPEPAPAAETPKPAATGGDDLFARPRAAAPKPKPKQAPKPAAKAAAPPAPPLQPQPAVVFEPEDLSRFGEADLKVTLTKPGYNSDIQIQPMQAGEPGVGEVKVKVHAFSLNFGDWLCVKGLYPTQPEYPFSPGFEAAGEAVAVGPGVDRVQLGDKVIALSGPNLGAHADYMIADQRRVVRLPANISLEEGSAFPAVFLTMWHCFEKARVQPGETVLVQTAAGGTGLVSVQLAQLHGAEVIATAGLPHKLDYLRRMGVRHLINYRTESFVDRVREITKGRGVDVVLNTLAGDAIQQGLDLLAPGGRYVEIAMTGLKSAKGLDFSRMTQNQAFHSVDMRRFLLENPDGGARYLDMMAGVLERGEVRPTVCAVFPFNEVKTAYQKLEDRDNIGKVVVQSAAAARAGFKPKDAAYDAEPPKPQSGRALPAKKAVVASGAGDIAVVGMSGRFPGAADLDAFWRNLAAGKSAIREVPPERWPLDGFYDADPEAVDRSYAKWGGFLDEIDLFDPFFFSVSPGEAEVMDPQHRLFLQEAWRTLEDAGYADRHLNGVACGVFVGCAPGDYYQRIRGAGAPPVAHAFTGNSASILAARIAYLLNLQGPAVAIDTACSSSLVALHLACESVRNGSCDMALAGGAFITVTPEFFKLCSSAGMLSTDGQCFTFDQRANGFVPGEGVGAVLLKPLDKALADGDPIHAVIKGSGVNQDGKTNGITAPSALSQTRLEAAVYEASGVNPDTLGYIEAHGTGTKLGDPIEIDALTESFGKHTDRRQFCAIGSVKTNMGHAVTAAGVAGLTKLILSLERRQIPPSLNFEKGNEHIPFEDSPFFVNTELRDWERGAAPRRGAVSSFGFSGTNAHVIVEEAPEPAAAKTPEKAAWLAVLSAKTETALTQRARDLRAWLDAHPEAQIGDVAHTLLTGRSHFPLRVALVAADLDALSRGLDDFLERGFEDCDRTGDARDAEKPDAATLQFARRLIEETSGHKEPLSDDYREKLEALAIWFLKGLELDWDRLYRSEAVRRLHLPAYVFDRESFWVHAPEAATPLAAPTAGDRIHPLVHRNESTFEQTRFTAQFNAGSPFIADHVVAGRTLLPGVASIEMGVVAGRLAAGKSVAKVTDIVWRAPIFFDAPAKIRVDLRPETDGARYQVYAAGELKRVHAQGRLVFGEPAPPPASRDLEAIKRRCAATLSGDAFYRQFQKRGFVYGPLLQAVQTLWRGHGEALALLAAPDVGDAPFTAFTLHPSLMDAALQTISGVIEYEDPERPYLPFTLEAAVLHRLLPKRIYVHVKPAEGAANKSNSDALRFDLALLDEQGAALIDLRAFELRRQSAGEPAVKTIEYYRPEWRDQPLPQTAAAPPAVLLLLDRGGKRAAALRRRLQGTEVILVEPAERTEMLKADHWRLDPQDAQGAADLAKSLSGKDGLAALGLWLWEKPATGDAWAKAAFKRFDHGAVPLFSLAKALYNHAPNGKVDFCIAWRGAGDVVPPECLALDGMVRSIRLEHDGFRFKLLDIAAASPPLDRLAEELSAYSAPVELVRLAPKSRSVREMNRVSLGDAKPAAMPKPLRQGGFYWIAGGLGGLGMMLARLLAAKAKAKLLLTGRSASDDAAQAKLKALNALGGDALYVQADIADEAQTQAALTSGVDRFGPLRGVFHCAGTTRDKMFFNKDIDELRATAAPKVRGVVNMDRATADQPLDFFVMYASLASVIGNAGQSDYALANGFLDGFAALRESWRADGRRDGRTLALDWPLWRDGGMSIKREILQLLMDETGIAPFHEKDGLRALFTALNSDACQIAPAMGDRAKIAKTMKPAAPAAQPTHAIEAAPVVADADPRATRKALERHLAQVLAVSLKTDPERIDRKRAFQDFGVDSFLTLKIVKDLEADFGALPKTLLFENHNLQELAAFFLGEHGAAVAQRFAAADAPAAPATGSADPRAARKALERRLAETLAAALKTDPDRLDRKRAFQDYGVDSFLTLKVIKDLERDFGSLPKTLLFENHNLAELAGFLTRERAAETAALIAAGAEPTEAAAHAPTQPEPPTKAAGHEPVLVHQDDLDPELARLRDELYQNAHTESSISRGAVTIAPYLFLGSERRGFFHVAHRDKLLLVYAFTGEDGYFDPLAAEVLAYASAHGLTLAMLSERHLAEIGGEPVYATPFGVIQRVHNLQGFSLKGNKMRRLRYMIGKFEKLGACRVVEHKPGADPAADRAVAGLVDRWLENKTQVNPLIHIVKREILDGTLDARHRLFVAYLDEAPQCAILITPVRDGKTHLMDLEFYGDDMPLGGLEYTISHIIETLIAEGVETYSLGGTYGPKLTDVVNADPRAERMLEHLRGQDDFGAGNVQFKNKFRPENTQFYLCRPVDGPEVDVTEVLMAIADPELRDQPAATAPAKDTKPAAAPAAVDAGSLAQLLADHGYNPINMPAESTPHDLLTDSWAQLKTGYVRTRMDALRERARRGERVDPIDQLAVLFPFAHFALAESGRAAEALLCEAWPRAKGKRAVVVQNLLFPTWIAHQINGELTPIELPASEALDLDGDAPFKGNLDVAALRDTLAREGEAVAFACIELADNAAGGHPVSLENLRQVKQTLAAHDMPLILDATRILENAHMIIAREPGRAGKSPWSVVRELCALADGLTASLCKDFGLDVGGVVAVNDAALFAAIEAKAPALDEETRAVIGLALADQAETERLTRRRMDHAAMLRDALANAGAPVAAPVSTHCVTLDATRVPGLAGQAFPLQSFLAWLFRHTGVRAGVHNAGMQKNTPLNRLVRLAVPFGLPEDEAAAIAAKLGRAFAENLPATPLTMVSKPKGFMAESKAEFRPAEPGPAPRRQEAGLPEAEPPVRSAASPATRRARAEGPADIAIVGVSGRYPQADTLAEFWRNLAEGRDCITPVPSDRDDFRAKNDPASGEGKKPPVNLGGFINDVDKFDPLFFNISPREAENMDPQERLFLQVAWETLEDAGYTPESIAADGRRNIGVFAAAVWTFYGVIACEEINKGNLNAANSLLWSIANRVSSIMDFHGPSMLVDTACSGSLTALHLACESILRGECRAAIAGGVNLDLHPDKFLLTREGSFLAEDCRCRAFGQGGTGYVAGEGVGAVLLKPLEDALADGDHVYAVIKGIASNHGGKASGYSVPNPNAQAELIAETYRRAGYDPNTVSYIEAHGTGTQLGDPIEITGLTRAFKTGQAQDRACAIGSVKSNIGHLEAAAGVAGLTKVLLQMKRGQLAPSLHATTLNQFIDFEQTPFRVQRELGPWTPDERSGGPQPLRAGLSSFGAGGSNIHVALEAHPAPVQAADAPAGEQLIALSARDEERLRVYAGKLADWLGSEDAIDDSGLADLAFTLRAGRRPLKARLAVVADNVADLETALRGYAGGGTADEKRLFLNPAATVHDIEDEADRQQLARLFEERDPRRLAELWVAGDIAEWTGFDAAPRRRLSAPTYPFAKDPYWVKVVEGGAAAEQRAAAEADVAEINRLVAARDEAGQAHFFQPVWEPWSGTNPADPVKLAGPILVFDRDRATLEQLEDRLAPAEYILVKPGRGFRKAAPRVFEINPAKAEDYHALLTALRSEELAPQSALHLWTAGDQDLDDLDRLMNEGVYSIYNLVRAMAALKLKSIKRFCFVGGGRADAPNPALAAVAGFAKSLALLFPSMTFAAIQALDEAIDEFALADLLRDELAAQLQDFSHEVRYVRGRRQIMTYKPVEAPVPQEPVLREGGVYLITGGAGELGLMFARHLVERWRAKVALTGRSELSGERAARVAALNQGEGEAVYLRGDVADPAAVRRIAAELKDKHGAIHGVIHAAGFFDPAPAVQKERAVFDTALRPKIQGTLALDEALREERLDFFMLFSSISAALGDFGQCDYASANRFQDSFAHMRERLRARGQRHGATIAADWPLWRHGGMHFSEEGEALYLQSSGMTYLETDVGLDAFERMLAAGYDRLVVISGEKARLVDILNPKMAVRDVQREPKARPKPVADRRDAAAPPAGASLLELLVADLQRMVSDLLKIDVAKLVTEENLGDFGFDSIMLKEFADEISDAYGIEVYPTVFYAHTSLESLAEYLLEDYEPEIKEAFAATPAAPETPRQDPAGEPEPAAAEPAAKLEAPQPAPTTQTEPPPSPEPIKGAAVAFSELDDGNDEQGDVVEMARDGIAIIGMSGMFPNAADLDEFWDKLAAGEHLVDEVPEDRWDWRAYYGDPNKEGDKTKAKWGGFLKDVDKFDSLFFGISPAEAEFMDPQQRIFLQTVWRAVEDAGYRPSELSGSNTGLFVGVATHDYHDLLKENNIAIEGNNATGLYHAILANRVSYALNLRGPSEPIDTACSSALVAIHRAVQTLRFGECDLAIAGGVNLILKPGINIALSKVGMLSEDGCCRPFDKNANGYIRGEGSGAIVLKPLRKAVADGDHIYAVIKGTAVNHGGRANTLTSPNPNAQAEALIRAYERADIDPATVTYIEGAANGTDIGDPLEIDGLKRAFKHLYKKWGKPEPTEPHCAIGTVKANVGHLETAAGICGVIKTLLNMKHRTLTANIHLKEINPYIRLKNSPFKMVAEKQPWPALRDEFGEPIPRRAGVSSFGFGGVNAHVALEEHLPPEPRHAPADSGDLRLFLLSAKKRDRLDEYARHMVAFLGGQGEANAHRAKSRDALAELLTAELIRLLAELRGASASDIDADESFDEQGVDPMTIANLADRLEDRLTVAVEPAEIASAGTLSAAARLVCQENEAAVRNALEQGGAAVIESADGAPLTLADLAYTSQVGRDAYKERLAVTARSLGELTGKLERFLAGEMPDGARHGVVKGKKAAADIADPDLIRDLLGDHELEKLAELWVKGGEIDWAELHGDADPKPRRVAMPTYPFAKKRCWFPIDPNAAPKTPAPAVAAAPEPEPATAPEPEPAAAPKPTAASTPEPEPEPAPAEKAPEPLSEADQAAIAEQEAKLADELARMVADHLRLEIEELDYDEPLDEYGFDSFTGIKLINSMQDQFGLKISARSFFDYPTIRDIAAYVREHGASGEPTEPAFQRRETYPDRYPLSENQKALWFIHQMEPDNYAFHLPSAFSVRQSLDVDAFRRAFDLLVQRHAAFRMVFRLEGSEPACVVLDDAKADFHLEDAARMDEEAFQDYLVETAQRPFDLEQGPLMRVNLFNRGKHGHVLLMVHHHAIFDGSSFGIFFNDLLRVYGALISGQDVPAPELSAEYVDFVDWQRHMLESEEGEAHWQYWREHLAGELPVLNLPADYSRPPQLTYSGEVIDLPLEDALFERLKQFAKTERTSMFTVLLAAYHVLLHRYTQQKDIVVGTPMAGRPRRELEAVVGYFVNMIPIRADLGGAPSFRDFLKQVHEAVLNGIDHGDFPFPTMLNRLEVEHDQDQNPVFQVAFILQNWVQDMELAAFQDGLENLPTFDQIEAVHETGGFDLTLEVLEVPKKSKLYLKYNPDLFKRSRIERLAGYYLRVLESALAGPDRSIGMLEMLPEEEKHKILHEFNDTQADFPEDKAVFHLFEQRVAEDPDKTAVVFEGEELSYGELNRRANRVAHRLIELGIGPETLVGVCVDRSLDMMAAVMGVMKSGGAYVPLDQAYPKERLAFMLGDVRPPVVVTQSSLVDNLPLLGEEQLVLLDTHAEDLAKYPEDNPNAPVTLDNLAYVIFTSGSTGKPKGVMVMHRTYANAYLAWEDAYRLRTDATAHLQMANFSFDVFSGDLSRALCSGAKLVIAPRELLLEPEKLYALMIEQQVDAAEFVPAVLRGVIGYLESAGKDLRFMKLLVAGSDSWSVKEYDEFRRYCGPDTRLINSYGVTESTIDTTYFESGMLHLDDDEDEEGRREGGLTAVLSK